MEIINKRFIWQKNIVFSLKQRDGSYALLQMLEHKGQVAVYRHCRKKDEWEDVVLSPDDVYFTCYVLRAFTSRSTIIIHKEIKPIKGLKVSETKINATSLSEMTLWKGTKDERTFIACDGKNGIGLHNAGRNEKGEIFDEFKPIDITDYDKYKDFQMSGLGDYPEFNERVFLCHKYQKFFDPAKELAFNRPLDLDCRTYIDLISGKVLISKLGY